MAYVAKADKGSSFGGGFGRLRQIQYGEESVKKNVKQITLMMVSCGDGKCKQQCVTVTLGGIKGELWP